MSSIRQTNHLVTIPHPLHPFYVVSTLHLRDSLFVWVGETSMGAAEEADRLEGNSGSGSNDATQTQTLSEEEQRQQQVDEQIEQELSRALEAAGRGGENEAAAQDGSAVPKGFLAREWAASMFRACSQPIGTSLFRTPSDIALPMSRRLAKRLQIQQIHLSLSLPDDLFPVSGNMPAPPGANQALLAIEKGIEESIEASRSE